MICSSLMGECRVTSTVRLGRWAAGVPRSHFLMPVDGHGHQQDCVMYRQSRGLGAWIWLPKSSLLDWYVNQAKIRYIDTISRYQVYYNRASWDAVNEDSRQHDLWRRGGATFGRFSSWCRD